MQTHSIKKSLCILTLSLTAMSVPMAVDAQRTANVSGKYTYILSENDNVTIKEAKNKAIEEAKADAIKKEFGMLVTSDFINTEKVDNDEFSTYYMSDTQSSAKGIWLGDERDPVVTVECSNGDIIFTAEVWGKAREIVRAKPDLKCMVMKDVNGQRVEANDFNNGERFYVTFQSPTNGFVAIYLITGDNETACLLPYSKDNTGRCQVKGGKEYTFFDKTTDSNPFVRYYKLTTDQDLEYNTLVIVYSPNPFTKCTDTSNDPRHPNSLKSKDFAKWLLKNQHADNDMYVERKILSIKGVE